jgi:hypothetical protein
LFRDTYDTDYTKPVEKNVVCIASTAFCRPLLRTRK